MKLLPDRNIFNIWLSLIVIASLILIPLGVALSSRSQTTDVHEYWKLPVTSAGAPQPGAHPLVQSYDTTACGACHINQHQDWRASVHAQAFSPGLAGQLPVFSRTEQEACLACHAPRVEQQVAWFKPGQRATVEGVDCAACHVRKGTRFGPREVDLTPHGRVEASALFKRSEFCSVCHQFGPEGFAFNGKPLENTYEEWKATRYARDNVTCQGCHMPGGRHEFRGIHDPEMTRRGLAVRAVREHDRIRLTATNAGAGHHLPTYTTPLIRIEISGKNKRREHVLRRELAWDAQTGLREVSDTRLAAGESVSIALELPARAFGHIVVTVDPGYDYHARIFPDLIASLGTTLSSQAQAMLRSARNATRSRAYVLYRLRCEPWRGHDADCVALP